MTLTTHSLASSDTDAGTAAGTVQAAMPCARKPTVWRRVAIRVCRNFLRLSRWRRNREAWRHVSELPDELLRDVGLSRNEARNQLTRPLYRYWQDDGRSS